MNYWVREHPPGAHDNEVEHWKLLGGENACNQIPEPMKFPTWDMAQSMANALANNEPTDYQRLNHEGDAAYHLKREGTKGAKALEAWRTFRSGCSDTKTLQLMKQIEKALGMNDEPD